MAPIGAGHHHRNTTKTSHKPFKTRHASKNAQRDQSKGRIETADKGRRRTPHQQVMSKIDRRNQARQKRQTKHQQHAKITNVFAGRSGAPRIVALVPLCGDIDMSAVLQSFTEQMDVDTDQALPAITRASVKNFKQKIDFLSLDRDIIRVLDACRIADYIVLVLSAREEVDSEGEFLLKCIEGQGMPNTLVAVQGLERIEPAKRRSQVSSSLKSFITHFLPAQDRIHSLDLQKDVGNIVRSLCTTTPKGIRWRENRSWMLVEEVRWPEQPAALMPTDSSLDQPTTAVVTGTVRGRGLNVDRLVHVGDWGDFQIDRIVVAPKVSSVQKQPVEQSMDLDEGKSPNTAQEPTQDQDDLAELAPEEVLMTEVDADADRSVSEAAGDRRGVLLDDHHYFSDEETLAPTSRKKLPKGTSSYQSAWYLDDVSDSESDVDDPVDNEGDLDMDARARPEDGTEGLDQATQGEPTEMAPSEYPQSEMFLDPSPEDEAEQLKSFRSRKQTEAEEDAEFPDEIELLPNVLARERLARYRGLKSMRTSPWETEEDRPYQPPNWNRLLQVLDYKGTLRKVTNEALVGGILPGSRVEIHLRNVPSSLQKIHDPSQPLPLFSLLRHERKSAVVNVSITLGSEQSSPLRSKDEIIVQCGPRRFVVNPIFSQGGETRNHVHKFDRFLHPGRHAIATFIAPVTWGSVPVLFFKRTTTAAAPADPEHLTTHSASSTASQLELIGTGTNLPPSSNRVIAKRVILTGHPYKIHKKLVTIRYMFFNADDVNWFKALPLWTRRGRSGFIKESLGTHGYFKATFDGRVNPQDSIGVSLYKRMWPREARAWMAEE
ncbi:MAG: hypothetical protein M1825_001099 [Sarcosagium campestre]|nr:MAG: hypothetical protein M1825_001099 [Sarcosagium campestre]